MARRLSKNATANDFSDVSVDNVSNTQGSDASAGDFINPPIEAPTAQNTSVVTTTNSSVITATVKDINNHLKELDNAVNNCEKSFFKIGLNLYWFYCTGAYCDINGKGYNNISEFAKDRYGIKKATTYQFLNIYERFGKRSKSGEVVGLDDKYSGYNSTALILMSGFDDETLDKCSPTMKVKEIKALKREMEKSDTENESTYPDGFIPPVDDVDGFADNTFSDTVTCADNSDVHNESPVLTLYEFTNPVDVNEKWDEVYNSIVKVLTNISDGHNYKVTITMSY